MSESQHKFFNRGIAVCVAVCAVCIAVIAAGKIFSIGPADPSQAEPASPPSATYRVGETFDLVGQARDVDANGQETFDPWDFSKGWDWTGVMRFTVMGSTLYDSAKDAGFALGEEASKFYANTRMLVVEVNIQNVDATCRETTREENGAPSFNLTMFTVKTSDGQTLEPICFDAPQVEGLTWGADKSVSYTWVEAGSQASVRIGYPVLAQGVEPSLDEELQLVMQNGWYDGAPVVGLGVPSVAEAPYVAG